MTLGKKFKKPKRPLTQQPSSTDGFQPWHIARIISNPFFAINIAPLWVEVEPDLSPQEWFRANVQALEELGIKPYLSALLKTLSGEEIHEIINPARVITFSKFAYVPHELATTPEKWIEGNARQIPEEWTAIEFLVLMLDNLHGNDNTASERPSAPPTKPSKKIRSIMEDVAQYKACVTEYLDRVQLGLLSEVFSGEMVAPETPQLMLSLLAYEVRRLLNQEVLRSDEDPSIDDVGQMLLWMNQLYQYHFSPLWGYEDSLLHAELDRMATGWEIPALVTLQQAGIDPANL